MWKGKSLMKICHWYGDYGFNPSVYDLSGCIAGLPTLSCCKTLSNTYTDNIKDRVEALVGGVTGLSCLIRAHIIVQAILS
jgi:hypothetical protein